MNPLQVLALIASIGGTVASVSAQKKAVSAQKEQQALATRRERRKAIRQSQVQRARALSTAQATGAQGSSGVLGGVESIGSRVGSNIGFGTQMSGLSNIISTQTQRANTYAALANFAGGFVGDINLGGGNKTPDLTQGFEG